jgi:hypothetical protein
VTIAGLAGASLHRRVSFCEKWGGVTSRIVLCSSYLLAAAALSPLYGKLSDLLGPLSVVQDPMRVNFPDDIPPRTQNNPLHIHRNLSSAFELGLPVCIY